MNLKKAIGREKKLEADDLNITPVMNVFLILVPFLLLTAVFVRISILEFSLPTSDAIKNSEQQAQKNPVVTILVITENGFELKSKGIKIPPIIKNGEKFNYDVLINKLQEIKNLHQDSEDIILVPHAKIKYDTIIQVMDRCRENGFANISISG